MAAIALFMGLFLATKASAHSGFHENMEYLDKLIEKAPKTAELYHRRGENYRNHMKWDLAEADYQKALSLTNAFPWVALSQAKMAYSRQKFEETDGYLGTFLAGITNHWNGLLLRAQSHAAQNRFEPAVNDFEASIAANPRPVPSHFLELARVRVRMGKVDQALAGLEEARKKIGPVPTLYLEGLDIAEKDKQPQLALRILNELEQKTGTNPAWLVRRGKLLIQAEKPDEAVIALREARNRIMKLPSRRRNVVAQKMLLNEADNLLKIIESP